MLGILLWVCSFQSVQFGQSGNQMAKAPFLASQTHNYIWCRDLFSFIFLTFLILRVLYDYIKEANSDLITFQDVRSHLLANVVTKTQHNTIQWFALLPNYNVW